MPTHTRSEHAQLQGGQAERGPIRPARRRVLERTNNGVPMPPLRESPVLGADAVAHHLDILRVAAQTFPEGRVPARGMYVSQCQPSGSSQSIQIELRS
jgi:hypothetical protein